MGELITQASIAFTTRYCDAWHEKNSSWPPNEELCGVPSPCIVSSTDDAVFWQPQPFIDENNLNIVERAFDIMVQPAAYAFYTTRLAGDMHSRFADEKFTLLQTWSEGDFGRAQGNLIDHLVAQKRPKPSPTLFITTQGNEPDVISVCNLSGEVCEETLGAHKRTVLVASLAEFLIQLKSIL